MKEYLCKSCKYNYYGFCNKKKIDRLKQNNIKDCEFHKVNQHFKKLKLVKIKRIKNNKETNIDSLLKIINLQQEIINNMAKRAL